MKRKFAIPLADDQLSKHFGKASDFAIIETDDDVIINTRRIKIPELEHGKRVQWILDQGITHIISFGIGQKAIDRFQELNIKIINGVDPEKPEILVQKFLENKLKSGINLCDH